MMMMMMMNIVNTENILTLITHPLGNKEAGRQLFRTSNLKFLCDGHFARQNLLRSVPRSMCFFGKGGDVLILKDLFCIAKMMVCVQQK